MADAPHAFLMFSILVLLAVFLVFVMKYAASTYRARLELGRQTASEEAIAAQARASVMPPSSYSTRAADVS